MRRSAATAVLLAIALLAFPAVSTAQSAGDNQYSDPLQGNNGGNSSNGNVSSSPGGGGGGGSSSPSGSSGGGTNTPVSAPNTAAQAPTNTTAPGYGAQEGTPAAKGELPRTGFDVIVTIELGLAMLLGGLVMQRMVVLRDRRNHR
jgi:hypothetical protein